MNRIRTYAVSGYSSNQVKAVSEVFVSEDRILEVVSDLIKRGIDIIIIRKINVLGNDEFAFETEVIPIA